MSRRLLGSSWVLAGLALACGTPPPAPPEAPAPAASDSAASLNNPPTVTELANDDQSVGVEDGALHPEELAPGVRLGMSRAAFEALAQPKKTEGDAIIKEVHPEYANGRLTYFRFSVGKAGCSALRARFTAKYGAPTKNGHESFFDARGATIFVVEKAGGACTVGIQKRVVNE